MAAETVPRADGAAGPCAALKDFSDKHENALFDVVALLSAAADRIDAATPSHNDEPERADDMHNTMRLVQMAGEKVKAAAEALFNAG